MKKEYLHLCDYFSAKVGGSPMAWLNIQGALLGGVNTAIHLRVGSDLTQVFLAAGAATFLSVVLMHDTMPSLSKFLKKRHVSLKQGGRIIRAAQLVEVAFPMALMLTLHSLQEEKRVEVQEQLLENILVEPYGVPHHSM